MSSSLVDLDGDGPCAETGRHDLLVGAPSRGPEHRFPQDCWRFYPDAYRALAKYTRMDLLEVSTDWEANHPDPLSAPWGDTVGVFQQPALSCAHACAGALCSNCVIGPCLAIVVECQVAEKCSIKKGRRATRSAAFLCGDACRYFCNRSLTRFCQLAGMRLTTLRSRGSERKYSNTPKMPLLVAAAVKCTGRYCLAVSASSEALMG